MTSLCKICFEPLDGVKRTLLSSSCGHVCCKECLLRWLAGNTTCPECRQRVTTTIELKLSWEPGRKDLANKDTIYSQWLTEDDGKIRHLNYRYANMIARRENNIASRARLEEENRKILSQHETFMNDTFNVLKTKVANRRAEAQAFKTELVNFQDIKSCIAELKREGNDLLEQFVVVKPHGKDPPPPLPNRIAECCVFTKKQLKRAAIEKSEMQEDLDQKQQALCDASEKLASAKAEVEKHEERIRELKRRRLGSKTSGSY